jgi:hypothetical protein
MTGGIESYGVRRLDTAIANCSRLLLDRAPAELAVPEALTGLLQGLDAVHAMLFQIRSYHAEDYRGQWLTCSSAEDCTCCGDIRDWDYLQLLDARMRTEMEAGRSGRIRTNQLSLEFKQVMADRGVMALLVLPLTVMGKWWGCLCIEEPHYDSAEIPACRSDLQTLAALFSIHYERRQAAAGFQERDKLSGALEMAGTVCHKLNQPMQVILGYASMVTSGDIRDPDQIGEIVQLIEDETRQMGIITKNLMGITKHHRAG